ncbi:MAG: nucleotidyltransferase family protein [Nanoarchaeota archaeon]|nr:MAG: nucleotidyltransferase family protein [Nanoarchaeota archaeon]
MKVIIPAAGYATRLWPLTKETPKPLLPVKNKPIIEHIIDNVLEIKEVDHIYVVTNAKFYAVFKEWADSISFRVPLTLCNDGTTSNEDRLGQIGDIEFVIKEGKIKDDILIVAGDNLFNFPLKKAYDEFKKYKCILNSLYDIKSKEAASQLGVALVDKKGIIVGFEEKPVEPKSTLISQGVYFFPKDKVSLLAKYIKEGNNADKMGYFIVWMLKTGNVVRGAIFEQEWFDVGWHEALEHARKEFKGYK